MVVIPVLLIPTYQYSFHALAFVYRDCPDTGKANGLSWEWLPRTSGGQKTGHTQKNKERKWGRYFVIQILSVPLHADYYQIN